MFQTTVRRISTPKRSSSYSSPEFAFQFGQGVATAAYESFHDAFADVPPSASRSFVEALIPYMLARVS
jgi:hypothetical protein